MRLMSGPLTQETRPPIPLLLLPTLFLEKRDDRYFSENSARKQSMLSQSLKLPEGDTSKCHPREIKCRLAKHRPKGLLVGTELPVGTSVRRRLPELRRGRKPELEMPALMCEKSS